MLTFFDRHTVKLDIDTPTLERLWERSLIAIHYPEMRNGNCGKHDNESLDPNDYPRRSEIQSGASKDRLESDQGAGV
jgi:hypothetical protein